MLSKCVRQLLAMIAIFLGLTLVSDLARAQSNPYENDLAGSYRLKYYACFDRYGDSLPAKLNDLVAHLRQEQERFEQNNQDPRVVLPYLIRSYVDLGKWKEAKQTIHEMLAPQQRSAHVDRVYLDERAIEDAEFANLHLAGMSSTQRDWRMALVYYSRDLALRLAYTVLPITCLCWGWLLLWRLPGGLPGADRLHPGTLRPLLLLGLIPLFFFAFDSIVQPLNSLLIAGNVGTVFVNLHTGLLDNILSDIEFIVCLVVFAVIARKRGWLRESDAQGPAPATDPETSIPPRRTVRLLVIAGATALGLLYVAILVDRYWLVKVLTDWSASWQSVSRANGYWVVNVFIGDVLGSWAQELFFRGVVHRYARQAGGLGFGIVYSSLIFAGLHLNLYDFTELFWDGLLLAGLYEITRSLWAPTVVHSTHNILATVSYSIMRTSLMR